MSEFDLRSLLEALNDHSVQLWRPRRLQIASGVPPYSLLNQDAVDSSLLGVPVRVCSLSRLREMKQAQGRAQDQADLENLPHS